MHKFSTVQVAHSALQGSHELFWIFTKLPIEHESAFIQPYRNQMGVDEVDKHVEHTVESLKHKLQGLLHGTHSPVIMLWKLFAWHCVTHFLFYKKSKAVVLQLRHVAVVF